MNETPMVAPIPGEGCRYFATADVPDEMYIVDLLVDDGNGECGCIDYSIRCRPKLLENGGVFGDFFDIATGLKNTERTICKHIYMARAHYAKATLDHLSRARAGSSLS